MSEVIRIVDELRQIYGETKLCTNECSSKTDFLHLLKEFYNDTCDQEYSPSDVSTRSIFRDTHSTDESLENNDGKPEDIEKSEIDDTLDESLYGLPMESVLTRLYEENQKMRRFYLDQEFQYQEEKKAYEKLKEEYKVLKNECKTLRHRQKEEKRIKRTLLSDNKNDMNKQDRRRLKKFRSEVSLRLQLLESENKRFEMKIEKQISDLKREYADSYLFANPFPETTSTDLN
jgi:hypothetical protein